MGWAPFEPIIQFLSEQHSFQRGAAPLRTRPQKNIDARSNSCYTKDVAFRPPSSLPPPQGEPLERREPALRILLLVAASCLLFLPATVLAASTAAAISPSEALEALDKARTAQQIRFAKADFINLAPDSNKFLKNYVGDSKKDGRKRFFVLNFMNGDKKLRDRALALRDAVKHGKGELFRTSCIMEMATTRHPSLEPLLLSVLRSPDEGPMTQVAAAMALSHYGNSMGKERALKSIINAEVMSDMGIRTLEQLNALDTIPALRGCAETSPQYIARNRCRLAVLRIQLHTETESSAFRLMLSAMSEPGFRDVHQWIAQHLVYLGTGEAGKLLAKISKDSNLPGRAFGLIGLQQGIVTKKWTEKQVEGWLSQ